MLLSGGAGAAGSSSLSKGFWLQLARGMLLPSKLRQQLLLAKRIYSSNVSADRDGRIGQNHKKKLSSRQSHPHLFIAGLYESNRSTEPLKMADEQRGQKEMRNMND